MLKEQWTLPRWLETILILCAKVSSIAAIGYLIASGVRLYNHKLHIEIGYSHDILLASYHGIFEFLGISRDWAIAAVIFAAVLWWNRRREKANERLALAEAR